MNHIIPTATKNQKLVAKHIQACAKKLLNIETYEPRPYVKHCYLKNNFLYMTDAKTIVKFHLGFDAPGTGFFQLAMIGKELWLIDQDLDFEYPDVETLFDAEIPFCIFERRDTLNIKICKMLHAMSTPETIGAFDIEYLKIMPDGFSVYSTEVPYSRQIAKAPIVVHADNFQAVIMPINVN